MTQPATSEPATPEAAPAAPSEPASPSLLATPEPEAPVTTSTPVEPLKPGDYVNSDGTLRQGWAEAFGLDENVAKTTGTFPSIQDLATSFDATKRMVGKKVERPAADAPDEQLAEWRQLVGAPESADDYGSLRPETVPEESWDKEASAAFKELAFKHNLTPDAAHDIVALQQQMLARGEETHASALDNYKTEQIHSLKSDWGSMFDEKILAAKRFAATIGVDLNDPIFSEAAVVKAFANGATMVQEDKLLQGDAVGIVAGRRDRAMADMTGESKSLRSEEYQGKHGAERQRMAQQAIQDDLNSGT